MSWLDPVREALDARASAALIFFRNDDAGWDDARLRAMLDLFARCSVPLEVAVIPADLTASQVASWVAGPARCGRTTTATRT